LSYTLDEACLRSFPRRDLSAAETEDTRHGRPLKPAGIEGVYAATAPDGHVIALLTDQVERTKPVVVLRPATL
jgi:tRNA pseudouridine55 synthase